MSAVPSHHPKYRTKLCRNFNNGSCPFGQKCSFLHPAPGFNPLSSSFAQYLINWNMLLPHLLALQQEVVKKTSPRSPPCPQGPKLVDEDQSPPTSLLLSTSDSSSSEPMPQKKRSNKRKKLPCKQFIRTGGWCQTGEKCRFHHDVTALPSAECGRAQHAPPLQGIDMRRDGGQTTSGDVLMHGQMPSPPVISQEYSETPQFTEAKSPQPYQPLYWPGYAWQPYQPYYPFVPAAATRVPASTTPSSAVQHNMYHPPQPPVQNVPQNETQTSLPSGTYEVNGTTYFPTQMPPAPTPLVTCSAPTHAAPYNQAMPLAYPYYAPPPTLVNHYDARNQRMGVPLPISFDPFSSDPMMSSELPVVPHHHMAPIHDRPRLFSLPTVLSGDTADTSKDTQEQEFPYQPPKEQRVGHARRISINIKKHGHVSCG